MPAKGYSTVGLKPAVIERLQEVTDRFYPGMFLPSTLIILMNEVKRGHYTVKPHKFNLDLTGRYNTITIRSDIQQWLEENQETFSEEYDKTYRAKHFTQFVSYFIINVIESKYDANNHAIHLRESDFQSLQNEYQKQKKEFPELSFDQFVDYYINDLFRKIEKAKSILTI